MKTATSTINKGNENSQVHLEGNRPPLIVNNHPKVSPKDTNKSLAYYLDFYNKKHLVLSLENKQNQLSKSLKHNTYINNESLMKTNNQLLKNINTLGDSREMNHYETIGEKSLTLLKQKSNLEFSSNSQNSIISSYKTEIDNLKNRTNLNQTEIMNGFMKIKTPSASDYEGRNKKKFHK